MLKKLLDKKCLSIIATAAGTGILAALVLPFWLLVILEAVLLVVLGYCCWK